MKGLMEQLENKNIFSFRTNSTGMEMFHKALLEEISKMKIKYYNKKNFLYKINNESNTI